MERCKECNGIIVNIMQPLRLAASDWLWTFWGRMSIIHKQCFDCKRIVEKFECPINL